MGIQMKAPLEGVGELDVVSQKAAMAPPDLRQNERHIYVALCEAGAPQKAYDLLEDLRDKGLRSPMTIYRALDSLMARGHVRKIESINAFVPVRPDMSDQAMAFLICKKCRRTKEVVLDGAHVTGLFEPLPVSVADIHIEAFADCEDICADD